MKNKIFGTDGIRGEANHFPLDPVSAVRLGQSIARYFLKDDKLHSVLIGKDTRLSGYMIEYSLAAGLTSAGVNVYLTGPLPTAGIAYLTRSMRSDAGIMVSASHNPYEDNGIKIFNSEGFKLDDKIEEEITNLFYQDHKLGESVKPHSLGKIKRIDDARGRYIVSLKNFLPRYLSLQGMKIGLDCANGAAYQVAPLVFDELGASVVTRGISPSGRNINSGFGSLYPEVISKLVKDQNLDVGFSFDGDSDRLIVSDEKGNIIDGDCLLALYAKFYSTQNKLKGNKIVATVMSSLALDNHLKENNIEVLRAAVGDRYVLEMLKKENLSLGGEQSGHIIFLEDATCGDGILSAVKVLEIMLATGKPLSELVNDYIPFPQKLTNISIREKKPIDEIPGLGVKIAKIESELKTARADFCALLWH